MTEFTIHISAPEAEVGALMMDIERILEDVHLKDVAYFVKGLEASSGESRATESNEIARLQQANNVLEGIKQSLERELRYTRNQVAKTMKELEDAKESRDFHQEECARNLAFISGFQNAVHIMCHRVP